MRATDPKPSLRSRLAALTVAVLSMVVALVTLTGAYAALGQAFDARIGAISVVTGVVAGFLTQRRLAARQSGEPARAGARSS